METKALKQVIDQIHRRFPEFAGVQPKVQTQRLSSDSGRAGRVSQAKSSPSNPNYLLTFHSKASMKTGAQSKILPRWVRVVVNDRGKILKITTSR